jgi:hypothetical protein
MRFLQRSLSPNGNWVIAGTDFEVINSVEGFANLDGVSRHEAEQLHQDCDISPSHLIAAGEKHELLGNLLGHW